MSAGSYGDATHVPQFTVDADGRITGASNVALIGGVYIDVTKAPYNAVGDNVADDATAIQNALNAAEAAGGGVVFVPGKSTAYRIGTGLTVGPNTTLMGAGRKVTQLHYALNTGACITVGNPALTGATPQEQYGGVSHLGVIGQSSTNTADAFLVVKARGGYFVDLMADTIGTAYHLVGGTGAAVEWNGVHFFSHIYSTQVSNGVFLDGYNSDVRFMDGDILGKGGVFGSRVGIGLRMTDRTATCVFKRVGFQAFHVGYSIETLNTGSDFLAPREENNDIPIQWINDPQYYSFVGGNGVFREPQGQLAAGIDDGDFWNGRSSTARNDTITWIPYGGVPKYDAIPASNAAGRGRWAYVRSGAGVADQLAYGFKDATDNYVWQDVLALVPPQPQPSDYGFKGWNLPVGVNAGASTPVMVTLVPWLFKIPIPRGITLVNLHVNVATAGATLTAGSNVGAIYLSNGTRIATTADQSTLWTSTGFKTMALTADASQSLTVPGGPGAFIWASLLAAGTTIPAFTRWSAVNANWTNGLLTAANAAVGKLAAVTAGSGPPTTFTPGTAITLTDPAHWVGVS